MPLRRGLVFSTGDILKATNGRLLWGKDITFSGASIDSRTIREGEIFFALRGQRFDGHDFLDYALKAGSGAVVNFPPPVPPEGKVIIHVNNTLQALQRLASYQRDKRDIPVIGITGSNGKTTTKELIASIMGMSKKVLKNEGNLNNNIGLPLSLLRLQDEDVVVLEMGMNTRGEIAELCRIARPTYGLITNIGPAHLENLGGMDEVRKTKLELLNTVDTVVVNADDTFLMEGSSDFKGRVLTFGIERDADVRASDILLNGGNRFRINFNGPFARTEIDVHMPIHGRFNISNALGASAMAMLIGATVKDIKDGLESYTGFPMRLEVIDMDGIRLINDAYNANPASMEAALRELVRQRDRGKAIAILGDMLELGESSEMLHRQIGRLMSEIGVDIFIAVGPMMAIAAKEFSGESHIATDIDNAGSLVKDIPSEGDTVLLKGSRAMGMERLVSMISKKPQDLSGHPEGGIHAL